MPNPKRLAVQDYQTGILSGDRYLLSRAITLVESRRASDQALAQDLLEALMPHTGQSIRVGITGVPGVGKSTFIEQFGCWLTGNEKKIAVLAIDPSSPMSKGSILGDKTRMNALAQDPRAFIRPSATGNALGGVGQKTREAMLLCEAAGYEIVLVETVGVGQSETMVRGMVDFFLLLMLPGAGDELQGIKRGIMEMADALLINKADGNNLSRAKQAQRAYQNALHLFPPAPSGWLPPVLTGSALQAETLIPLWDTIMDYSQQTQSNGYWHRQRRIQNRDWLYTAIRQEIENDFFGHPAVQAALPALEQSVAEGQSPPRKAALDLLQIHKNLAD
ncbi:MAG: methylmalonyl Co-A mutase-associated GTPase MeaB [Bernardetiaceae bacterium]